jgi:hypothetical protein
VLGELFLHRGTDRNAVENRVDGDTGKELLLGQRDAELFVGPQQLRIDVIEALERLDALRRRIVDEGVIVDGGIFDVPPVRLFHREPAMVALEPPIQHELGFFFLLGDEADDVLVEPGRDGIRLHVRDEPVCILAVYQRLNCRAHPNSLAFRYFPS